MNKFLNAIKWHWINNKTIVLSFIIIWVFICSLSIIFLSFMLLNHFTITINNNTADNRASSDDGNPNFTYESYGVFGACKYIVSGICGMIFFSIFSLVMINKTFFSDSNNKTIGLWLSFPISKIKIYSIKIISIFIPQLMSWFFVFIFSIIYSSFAVDAKENIASVILIQFNFLFLLILINSIFIFLSILFFNSTITNIVISILILFFATEALLSVISDMAGFSNAKWFHVIEKISLVSLIPSYNQQTEVVRKIEKVKHVDNVWYDLYICKIELSNAKSQAISFAAPTLISPILLFGSEKIFERKQWVI